MIRARNADAVMLLVHPSDTAISQYDGVFLWSEIHVRQVGRENLVGQENGALLCMMRNLEIERVTLAAMGLGIARCGRDARNS